MRQVSTEMQRDTKVYHDMKDNISFVSYKYLNDYKVKSLIDFGAERFST